MSKIEDLQGILLDILEEDTLPCELTVATKLREDLGLDSLQLAQLTVGVEDEFDVDIFEDGVISTVGEILTKIEAG